MGRFRALVVAEFRVSAQAVCFVVSILVTNYFVGFCFGGEVFVLRCSTPLSRILLALRWHFARITRSAPFLLVALFEVPQFRILKFSFRVAERRVNGFLTEAK